MSKSLDYGDLDVFMLSDRSLCHWLDNQDDEWKELPDERELERLEYALKRKSISQIGHKLRLLIPKRRCYANQPV